MRVDVAFTPEQAAPAPLGIVVDVLRATSTIAQALASGYRRVLCCAEIEDARALRERIPDSLVGGERLAVRIEGFDVGASPREFLEPRAETLILSTTNGTRAILETAERCEEVVLGSLLNLDAVARASAGRDAVVVCAGFQGAFALDDAYCAGRIVQLVQAERTDAAIVFFFKQKTAYDIGLGIPAEPLFRSRKSGSASLPLIKERILVIILL